MLLSVLMFLATRMKLELLVFWNFYESHSMIASHTWRNSNNLMVQVHATAP